MAVTTISTFEVVVWESLKSFLYFPIWWYTRGLYRVILGCARKIADMNLQLGFTIWFTNLFTPLFGQSDFAGRMVSFFVRLVNIIIRGLALLITTLIILAFIIIWIMAPVVIIYLIFS